MMNSKRMGVVGGEELVPVAEGVHQGFFEREPNGEAGGVGVSESGERAHERVLGALDVLARVDERERGFLGLGGG